MQSARNGTWNTDSIQGKWPSRPPSVGPSADFWGRRHHYPSLSLVTNVWLVWEIDGHMWSRTDTAGAGSTATTRTTLSSVRPRSVISDTDDQPLNLADKLISAPADPIEMLGSQLPQARRLHEARCVWMAVCTWVCCHYHHR